MAGTVVAVFNDKAQAERAAHALIDSGVPLNDISLVRKDAGGETGAHDQTGSEADSEEEEFSSHSMREVSTHDVERPLNTVAEIAPWTTVGVVTGAPLGALLVVTSLVIPGMGPILAAGPLVAMLAGSIAGGVIGGLLGAFTAGGIPHEAAESYHQHIENGDTLVAVLAANHNFEEMEEVLQNHGGSELGYFPRFIDSLQSIES
jgi:hypothetical protein